MRSLSSSMLKTFRTSAIGLRVSEPRGAAAEGQRPQQSGFKRGVQPVALQQKYEGGRGQRMKGHQLPGLHRAALLLPVYGQCTLTRHVDSFSVVGPPTGAEN